MQIPTVKIKADATAGNEHGFVVINASDFDHTKHELLEGEDLPSSPADANAVSAPSMAELIAARDKLVERSEELDAREREVSAREIAVTDREQANLAEAERLAADKLAMEKAGTEKAPGKKAAAPADGEKK